MFFFRKKTDYMDMIRFAAPKRMSEQQSERISLKFIRPSQGNPLRRKSIFIKDVSFIHVLPVIKRKKDSLFKADRISKLIRCVHIFWFTDSRQKHYQQQTTKVSAIG